MLFQSLLCLPALSFQSMPDLSSPENECHLGIIAETPPHHTAFLAFTAQPPSFLHPEPRQCSLCLQGLKSCLLLINFSTTPKPLHFVLVLQRNCCGVVVVEPAALEMSQTHLDTFRCSLLWVTLL